jgi:hypothetical protein
MQRIVAAEGLEVLRPELDTRPRVYYKNLNRYTKCFIGGSVVGETDGVVDCLDGAQVELRKGDTVLGETRTDNYGDFQFDGLAVNSGDYRVTIRAGEQRELSVEVKLEQSVSLGKIRL